jgi:hypothetical protein
MVTPKTGQSALLPSGRICGVSLYYRAEFYPPCFLSRDRSAFWYPACLSFHVGIEPLLADPESIKECLRGLTGVEGRIKFHIYKILRNGTRNSRGRSAYKVNKFTDHLILIHRESDPYIFQPWPPGFWIVWVGKNKIYMLFGGLVSTHKMLLSGQGFYPVYFEIPWEW